MKKQTGVAPLTADELQEIFALKYGAPDQLGVTPRLYAQYGYHSPDDFYEALIARLVDESTRWADVGCGHMLFPSNPKLARILADRCRRLVGIDPDPNINSNPYIHEAIPVLMDDYQPNESFDLITLRMVAEHVQYPDRLLNTLVSATIPGSYVIIYTVNSYSPVPVLTRFTPMWLRHKLKGLLWRTPKEDTFPTSYRMNTRRQLRELMKSGGFRESLFYYLDDCRTLTRFPRLQRLELICRGLFRRIGLAYPENCLLGLYYRD